jgi:hypothetical protein
VARQQLTVLAGLAFLTVTWLTPATQAPVDAATGILYVSPDGSDSNPGTVARPLKTISRAARVAGPGMTVQVAPGSYSDPVVTTVNGTPTARIRFVSSTRGGAVIKTSGAYRAWMNRGDYVDIVGFDISAPDAHLGIQNEGSHVKTQQNHIHDIASHINDAGCDSNGGAGIVDSNYSATDNEISSNLVHDIGNYLNPIVPSSCWTIQGIYQSTPNSRVLNNIVYHGEAFGIHLWHAATGNVVANNLSFNNGVGGIQVGAGDSPGGVTADNYVVANNIVLDNPKFGIRASGSLGTRNQYLNNLLLRNGSTFTGVSAGTAGTLTSDPKFVNYQKNGVAAGGNYHLQVGSPAINAGTSTGAPTVDMDGATRPSGGKVDIGPYESGATTVAPDPVSRGACADPDDHCATTASVLHAHCPECAKRSDRPCDLNLQRPAHLEGQLVERDDVRAESFGGWWRDLAVLPHDDDQRRELHQHWTELQAHLPVPSAGDQRDWRLSLVERGDRHHALIRSAGAVLAAWPRISHRPGRLELRRPLSSSGPFAAGRWRLSIPVECVTKGQTGSCTRSTGASL